jgi:hypothetical protein
LTPLKFFIKTKKVSRAEYIFLVYSLTYLILPTQKIKKDSNTNRFARPCQLNLTALARHSSTVPTVLDDILDFCHPASLKKFYFKKKYEGSDSPLCLANP